MDRIVVFSAWVIWGVSASMAFATTYYIRADGTAYSKTTATSCSSPETAMHPDTHNVEVFEPGDTIVLCDDGGVIRSTVYPTSNGLEDAPIVYDGLGTAVLSGANLAVGWVADGGNIYVAYVGIEPRQVFADGEFCDRKGSRGELVNDLDWFWEQGSLYFYSSSGDPDTRYQNPGIEVGARDECFGASPDHLIIRGMTFRQANVSGLKAWNPGSDVTIENCIAEWNWQVGIDLNGDFSYDEAVIENNITRFNGTGGIGLQGPATNSFVRRNQCYSNGKFQSAGNDFEEEHRWTYGIKLWENFPVQEGNQIYFNECYDNGRRQDGDYQGRGVGIWIDGVAGNPVNPTVVRHNLIYGNSGNGIFVEISSNSVTLGNVLHNNATNNAGEDEFAPACIAIDSRISFSSSNNLVVNNTCYGGRVGIKIVTYDCQTCAVNDNIVKNNIVAAATEHVLYANFGGNNGSNQGSGNQYQYNNFGVESQNFINWGGIDYSTYADWEDAYGNPTHSIVGDPGLAGTSSTTLYLTADSACRDTGTDLGSDYNKGLLQTSVWTDAVDVADQDTVGVAWDVGAYIYFSYYRRVDPASRRSFDTSGVSQNPSTDFKRVGPR
jgi:hypothetical protein